MAVELLITPRRKKLENIVSEITKSVSNPYRYSPKLHNIWEQLYNIKEMTIIEKYNNQLNYPDGEIMI